MADAPLFDSRDLRRVLGTFVTGVTVVTTTDDEGRFHGVTANSFSSVSLDPPLVLWSQAVKSHSHPAFFKAERFAVNILAEDQIELSQRFAKSSLEKFAGIDVDIGANICWLIPTIWLTAQCRPIANRRNSPRCGSARARSRALRTSSTRRWHLPSGAPTVQPSPIGSRRPLPSATRFQSD
jgi:hypothetical protein